MVTGDYQHTGIAVARGVGMLPKTDPVIIVQVSSEQDRILPSRSSSWVTHFPGSLAKTVQPTASFRRQLSSNPHSESSNTNQLAKSPSRKHAWASNGDVAPQQPSESQETSAASMHSTEKLTFTLDSADCSSRLDPQQALTNLAQVRLLHPPHLCNAFSVQWLGSGLGREVYITSEHIAALRQSVHGADCDNLCILYTVHQLCTSIYPFYVIHMTMLIDLHSCAYAHAYKATRLILQW